MIRTRLTRHIATFFDDVRDEIEAAFNDLIPANTNGLFNLHTIHTEVSHVLILTDWVSIHALPTVQSIVARVSGRVFVGLPLCEWFFYRACIFKPRHSCKAVTRTI